LVRHFTRVLVRIEVVVRTPDGVETRGLLRDVSLNGLSVETDVAIPAGTVCAVRLLLGTGGEPLPVDARATVTRVGKGWLALHLQDVDPAGYEHFENLVLYNAPNADAFERELEQYADELPGIDPVEND
jgi:hypothetical protein